MRDPTGKVHKTFDDNFSADGTPFPCGQCLACRINKRRVWTHRMMLERCMHDDAAFVTLTYDDNHLPVSDVGLPTLRKRDVQLWLKRLRKAFGFPLRYYVCGEYGPETLRPHYHGVIFGLPFSEASAVLIDRTWSLGFIQIGDATEKSIQYVAGYVAKKVVFKKKDQGIEPEFALMSRKPGIGVAALKQISETLKDFGYDKNVPATLRHGPKEFPLGRFLRSKLSQEMAVDLPQDWRTNSRFEYFSWFLSSRNKTSDPDYLTYCIDKESGKVRSLLVRHKIYFRRYKL